MFEITFIMSICNTKKEWIKRSCQSVVKQTSPKWKLIIVDDGSDDETAKFIKEMGDCDDRITVHRQDKKGVSSARNYGMDSAKTDWITFIDADDWIEDIYVEEILNILHEHSYLEVLGIGHDDIWKEDCIVRLWGEKDYYEYSDYEKNNMYMALLQEPTGLKAQPVFFGAQWKFIYSRGFLDAHNIRNNPKVLKAQDSVFNLYVTEHASKIGYLNKVLYHYFHNSESVTGGGFDENIVSKLCVLVSAYEEFIIKTGKAENPDYRYALLRVSTLQFEVMLDRYFCKKNGESKNKKKEVMNELLDSNPYKRIISYECEKLSRYRKIMIRLMRKKSYFGVKMLYRIKTLYADNIKECIANVISL